MSTPPETSPQPTNHLTRAQGASVLEKSHTLAKPGSVAPGSGSVADGRSARTSSATENAGHRKPRAATTPKPGRRGSIAKENALPASTTKTRRDEGGGSGLRVGGTGTGTHAGAGSAGAGAGSHRGGVGAAGLAGGTS